MHMLTATKNGLLSAGNVLINFLTMLFQLRGGQINRQNDKIFKVSYYSINIHKSDSKNRLLSAGKVLINLLTMLFQLRGVQINQQNDKIFIVSYYSINLQSFHNSISIACLFTHLNKTKIKMITLLGM